MSIDSQENMDLVILRLRTLSPLLWAYRINDGLIQIQATTRSIEVFIEYNIQMLAFAVKNVQSRA